MKALMLYFVVGCLISLSAEQYCPTKTPMSQAYALTIITWPVGLANFAFSTENYCK